MQPRTQEISVLRPLLPTADELLPYLREIDATRWYTNYGPLVRMFEARLGDHFGVESTNLTTASNATLAIAQSLRALGAPAGSLCVMPAWTFVATAAAAVWAGLEPFFIDVEPGTWLISPEDVRKVAAERHVGAVVVVSAFGAPLDTHGWDSFSQETSIPVVIDAAAGFDSFRVGDGRQAAVPVVISLHATKVFGVGEGAVVLTGDATLAKAIRSFGNFGFDGSRDASLQGINAKMPEFAAATGLAQFDRWGDTRERWAELTSAFVDEARARPQLRLAPGFGEGWVSSFGLVELPLSVTANAAARLLASRGVESRKWWGEGCHRQTAYRDCGRTLLPNTERLGDQVLGLPFWLGLRRQDMRLVFQALDDALSELKVA